MQTRALTAPRTFSPHATHWLVAAREAEPATAVKMFGGMEK
jgi:hypothetical protein